MAKNKDRIQLTDTTMDMVMKMSGGNPGAVNVLIQILKEGDRIDPVGLGGFGGVLNLDSFRIYEDKIWMLYKDICGQSVADTMCILRAVQMGFLPREELHAALAKPYAKLDEGRFEEVCAQLRERLPTFAKY